VLDSLRLCTRKTIRGAASLVAERAKYLVPVDTGLLKANIKPFTRKNKRDSNLIDGYVITNTRNKSITYRGKARGSNQYVTKYEMKTKKSKYGYGAVVEVGRGQVGMIGKGGKIRTSAFRPMPAQPYLRPALKSSISDIKEFMRTQARKEALNQSRKRGRPRKTVAVQP
jgi:hypothetical protein